MNEEIENITRQCQNCHENTPLPAKVPTVTWSWPSSPWKRLHIDYSAPFMGHMFLVVIDSYSKWLEVPRQELNLGRHY